MWLAAYTSTELRRPGALSCNHEQSWRKKFCGTGTAVVWLGPLVEGYLAQNTLLVPETG